MFEGVRREHLLPIAFVALSGLVACSDDGKPNGPIIVIVASDAQSPATPGDGGTDAAPVKKKLGEECKGDGECESAHCFVGTKNSYCTLTCTPANAAQVCVAPFDGNCNNQGFCRRPN